MVAASTAGAGSWCTAGSANEIEDGSSAPTLMIKPTRPAASGSSMPERAAAFGVPRRRRVTSTTRPNAHHAHKIQARVATSVVAEAAS